MTEINFMKEALREAKKAFDLDEVPIGSVIVQNVKIIGRGYNTKNSSNDATNHAEIIAIREACKYNKDWRLNDCILYTTLEPCHMCYGAILESRIKKVVVASRNAEINRNDYKDIDVVYDVLNDESLKLIQKFFKGKRK